MGLDYPILSLIYWGWSVSQSMNWEFQLLLCWHLLHSVPSDWSSGCRRFVCGTSWRRNIDRCACSGSQNTHDIKPWKKQKKQQIVASKSLKLHFLNENTRTYYGTDQTNKKHVFWKKRWRFPKWSLPYFRYKFLHVFVSSVRNKCTKQKVAFNHIKWSSL